MGRCLAVAVGAGAGEESFPELSLCKWFWMQVKGALPSLVTAPPQAHTEPALGLERASSLRIQASASMLLLIISPHQLMRGFVAASP